MNKTGARAGGFSFIELMMALVILAIIAALAYPAYHSQVRKSRRTDAQAALVEVAALQERFFLHRNSYTRDLSAASCSGVGFGATLSAQGHYTISVTSSVAPVFVAGPPCDVTTPVSDFTVTATATGDQAKDSACTTMSINQAGIKAPADCWE